MKIIGFITEYNPFHNGHKYHMLESIKKTGATHTIAIMSGNFLQRGEPAITNKWIRAEMAVQEGVDLVLELPFAYACNSAEFFAFGGVSLLNQLNIVDTICFGSEDGSLEKLKMISEILVTEPILYKKYLKEYLSEGFPFPQARERALCKYCSEEDLHSTLHSPNNILAIEYLKALIKLKSTIKPYTIKRFKAPYSSTHIESEICSATAIRNYLLEQKGDPRSLSKVIPKNSFHVFLRSVQDGLCPTGYSNFDQMALYALRTLPKNTLSQILDVNEGLENRIKEGAIKSNSIYDLLEFVKTKRYAYTRLQRIIIHSLLGITRENIFEFNQRGGPQYARVLAFSSKGTVLLRKLKESSSIPIITNINKEPLVSDIARKMLSFDIQSTDIYSLGYPNCDHHIGSQDYYKKPYFLL